MAILYLFDNLIARSEPIALKAVAKASAYVADVSWTTVTDKVLLLIDFKVSGLIVCVTLFPLLSDL